jgi:hypothetical protein
VNETAEDVPSIDPEGHRNSDHARDLPIYESGPCKDHAQPHGLEHARDL